MWYIVRVKGGQEGRAMKVLGERFEVRWPVRKKVGVYVKGKRRYVLSLDRDRELVLGSGKVVIRDGEWRVTGEVEVKEMKGEAPFRGYVFVRGRKEEIEKMTGGVIYGILSLGGKLGVLSDKEMKEIEEKVGRGERVRKLVPQEGDMVVVTGGEYAGVKGRIEELGEDFLLIRAQLWGKETLIKVPYEMVVIL